MSVNKQWAGNGDNTLDSLVKNTSLSLSLLRGAYSAMNQNSCDNTQLLRPTVSNAKVFNLHVGNKWAEKVGGEPQEVVGTEANMRALGHLNHPSTDRSSTFLKRDPKSKV